MRQVLKSVAITTMLMFWYNKVKPRKQIVEIMEGWETLTEYLQQEIKDYLGIGWIFRNYHYMNIPISIIEEIDKYNKNLEKQKIHQKIHLVKILDDPHRFPYDNSGHIVGTYYYMTEQSKRNDMREPRTRMHVFKRCVCCHEVTRTHIPYHKVTAIYIPFSQKNICFYCSQNRGCLNYEPEATYIEKETYTSCMQKNLFKSEGHKRRFTISIRKL